MEFEDLKVEVPLEEDENTNSLLFDVPVKKYQNNDGAFVTGFDVTSKEAEERKLKRAKRFGISRKATESQEEKIPISSAIDDVDDLPKAKQDAEIRPDALLLFGVNEMSTKDVFDYFKDYMPGSIEWIDDMSCLVVWEDENSAKRAFVNMGTKYTPSDESEMSQEEESDNIWRIGNKHPKSKQLLIRYATKLDKKAKGAGSRSLYYLIHGTSDQQSQKKQAKKRGLVSSSRRRKINASRLHINEELSSTPDVEVFDIDETMETADDMDVDEPPVKVIISEDLRGERLPRERLPRGEKLPGGERLPRGNLYADQANNSPKRIRSRLSKRREEDEVFSPDENEISARVPSSAKMDEMGDTGSSITNNISTKNNGAFQDLRQKLKHQKQNFNPTTRPNLSIEVTED